MEGRGREAQGGVETFQRRFVKRGKILPGFYVFLRWVKWVRALRVLFPRLMTLEKCKHLEVFVGNASKWSLLN